MWQSADKLRNNMDAAEYKHVVLGLIFPELATAVVARGATDVLLAPKGGLFAFDKQVTPLSHQNPRQPPRIPTLATLIDTLLPTLLSVEIPRLV